MDSPVNTETNMSKIPSFATIDPFDGMTGNAPGIARNLVGGTWREADSQFKELPDPMNGQAFVHVPDTRDLEPFIDGLRSCPKYGMHNPVRNPQRYIDLGQVCARAAATLAEPEVQDYFTRLIQRVMPKSWLQCQNEVTVTRVFLENFAGDGVRFLARGFSNPGNHNGQESRGYRWPHGPVVVIAPFNFPLEIPALQTMGALFMGNRPLVKCAAKVSVVFEQFVRLLIHSGLPATDLDLIQCGGRAVGQLIETARDDVRMVQFTGSSGVAEWMSDVVSGRIRVEDAGFDWKVIGPDYQPEWLDYVAWQCDEDAYNASGQKCSAQSILYVHENWAEALLPELESLAARRNIDNLSIGPVLSWTNQEMKDHIDACLAVPGAELLFGGQQLEGHAIPDCYGAYQPTAVQVPVSALEGEHFKLVTTELFGPFQVVVVYGDDDLPVVLKSLEKMSHHLTAAVVSADIGFQKATRGRRVLAHPRRSSAPGAVIARSSWTRVRCLRGGRFPIRSSRRRCLVSPGRIRPGCSSLPAQRRG
jgi:1-pyrroline-5-carboxylate dehydrogenase